MVEEHNAGRQRKTHADLKADGLEKGTCPLMSCRLYEVVDGQVDTAIKQIETEVIANFHEAVAFRQTDNETEPLSNEDVALIKSEFHNGMSRLSLGLMVKLAWRKNLPWMLAGLAHPDISRAINFAKKCIAI